MSRRGDISFHFGGADRRFQLSIGPLERLQEATDCGPAHLLKLVQTEEYKTLHIREVLRWGLIGGGMPEVEAAALIKAEVDAKPAWQENAVYASLVLSAAIVGVPDEPLGKDEGAESGDPSPSSTASSGLPNSTGPAS